MSKKHRVTSEPTAAAILEAAGQPPAAPEPGTDVPLPPKLDAPARPLRLEWIEAGSLTANPGNWRRHSPEQLNTIRRLLDDPDVG